VGLSSTRFTLVRKAQRAKEIARNKKERRFQRDAHSLQSNPDAIKDELKEVLALEEDGKGNQTVRLKKKALQGAYDNAIKKKKVCHQNLPQF
jgi:predicted ribosome quality control (RQC) complex YloA/Tae2 family protein